MPLIWRRTWPVAVFLVIGIARETYDQVPLGYAPLPLGPAIAYFTVMDRCSTRVRAVISLLVLAGIIESQSTPGHSQPYDFSVAVLVFVAAGMAGILSRTRRAYLAEVEARAARAESQRDQEAALAAAGERTSIARELHDVVAHHVSLMAVQAEAAASLLPGHPVQARSSVEIIGQTAREALTELRRLLGVLRGPAERPETAPSPSLDELDALLGVVRGAGLAVDLHVTGQPFHLAHGVDLTAYRIVQEALTNTLRHAPQATAAVTLSYEPGYLTVAVVDSGPGTLAATGALLGTGTVTPAAAGGRRGRGRAGRQGGPAEPARQAGTGRFRAGRDRRAGRLMRRQHHGRPDRGGWLRGHRQAAGPMTTVAGTDPIRVLVVDDQELVRSGFCVILEAAEGITVVGEAANGVQAVAAVAAVAPTWCSWTCACRKWTGSRRPG